MTPAVAKGSPSAAPVPIAVVIGTKRDRMGTQKKPPPKPSSEAKAPPPTLLSPTSTIPTSAFSLWGCFRLCLAKKAPGENGGVGCEDDDDDAAVDELGDRRGAERADHDGGRKNGRVFQADGAPCGVSLGACERSRDHKRKRGGGGDLGYVRACDADMRQTRKSGSARR